MNASEESVVLETVDPLSDASWDESTANYPEQTVFHRSSWAKVLIESYGHRPIYKRLVRGGEEIGLLPIMEVKSPVTGCRGVSLPFSDLGGPLIAEGVGDLELDESLFALARDNRWKHLEIRGGLDYGKCASSKEFKQHCLDLRKAPSELMLGFDSSVRRAIRRAEQSELKIEVESSRDAMSAFYELHSLTRRRHGLPPQPMSFFLSIVKHLFSNDEGEVVLARLGGKAVAGAVYLRSGPKAIYKYGASDPSYWSCRPNQLVMWRAIQFLADRGCESLHFGRSALSDEGLNRFKRSWGAVESSLRYFKGQAGSWIPSSSDSAEMNGHVFGYLPLPLNRLAGRLIYPHLD